MEKMIELKVKLVRLIRITIYVCRMCDPPTKALDVPKTKVIKKPNKKLILKLKISRCNI